MLKANMLKKPQVPLTNDIILEEGGEEGESLANIKLIEAESEKDKGNLPISKLIDDELATVKINDEETKNEKANKQIIKQMVEEKARIKLKEEKLRDATSGGVFMNSLATKASSLGMEKMKPEPAMVDEIKKTEEAKSESAGEETKLVNKPDVLKKPDLGEDEWDKINEQRNQDVARNVTHEGVKIEELTYTKAWTNLSSQDLSKEMGLIVREDKRYLNIFQKIFAGCMTRFKLDTGLHAERDIILALMKAKVTTDFHSCMLMRVFQLISSFAPPEESKNWVLIGFQGNNPETDIRGTGLFGLLQVLYFVEKYPKLAQRYFLLSIDNIQRFPLVVVMFGFTALAAEALREGRLTTLCNKQGNVIDIMNLFFAGAFNRFMKRWEKEKLTIIDRDACSNENKEYCKENIKKLVEDFITETNTIP